MYCRGQSFHFAPRFASETFLQSIIRHEWYIASRLNVSAGQLILDVGCGVGGPMRNIARFTKARIIGINNNAYQLTRVAAKNRAEGLADTCSGTTHTHTHTQDSAVPTVLGLCIR